MVVEADSELTLESDIKGKRVLVVEDGPTLTHGEMQIGAGLVAAKRSARAKSSNRGITPSARSPSTYQKYPENRRGHPAGDGLFRSADQRPAGHDQRDRRRYRPQRHPDRPDAHRSVNKPVVRVQYDLIPRKGSVGLLEKRSKNGSLPEQVGITPLSLWERGQVCRVGRAKRAPPLVFSRSWWGLPTRLRPVPVGPPYDSATKTRDEGIPNGPLTRTADSVVMARPRYFGFNEQTGLDNEFQSRLDLAEAEINRRANDEFGRMVDRLRTEGVDCLILEPDPASQTKLPDAVFPNNWFSTEHDGTLLIYPMKTPNRRAERRTADLERLLRQNGRVVRNVLYVGRIDEDERFLEGTGSLVIDHAARVVYAVRSQRCDPAQFENFLRLRSYSEGILFDAVSSRGRPIYHTNVMMSLGDRYAVICPAAIPAAAERSRVLESLGRGFDVIEISPAQMEEHYCGNILQLRNRQNEPLIVMSLRAEKGFTPEQRARLAAYGKVVSVDLETIETIGGGSARCMLAEVFLPRGGRKQDS